ncbi:MAG: LysM peptidoglycan-binding domain-containing protein [Oscillospiraceae bacterium]|jgi:LysM repeat protein|nr:LysM peptidoglycan-binding domain-containing protein [Oscillospiraceae bacterium]
MLKKILSLALVVAMIATLGLSALAYDATNTSLPYADSYYITHYTHNVVRGETLSGIAAQYGTTVEGIKIENAVYFADLAKKNATWGVAFTLEPGITLNIYTTKTVLHYVVKGDTLASIAATYGTTEAAIRAENPQWFTRLNLLNKTQASNLALVESDVIDVVGDATGWNGNKVNDLPAGKTNLVANYSNVSGTALKISVLVKVLRTEVPVSLTLKDAQGKDLDDPHLASTGGIGNFIAVNTPIDFREYTVNYQGANTESRGNVTPDPWYISEDVKPFGYRDLINDGPRAITAGDWSGLVHHSFVTTQNIGYKVDGPNAGGSTAAVKAFYTVKAGDTLAGIAKQFGTTVDAIRLANASYFANLATRSQAKHGSTTAVAVEAGETLVIA